MMATLLLSFSTECRRINGTDTNLGRTNRRKKDEIHKNSISIFISDYLNSVKDICSLDICLFLTPLGKPGSLKKPVVHKIPSVVGNLFTLWLICYFLKIH
jgi:hypothetical protein